MSNPAQAQQAIDAAYRRGVPVIASMADEASKHPNLPASLEHTLAVNSVTEKEPPLGGAVEGYLALNGCTNFGGHTFVSIPSGVVLLGGHRAGRGLRRAPGVGGAAVRGPSAPVARAWARDPRRQPAVGQRGDAAGPLDRGRRRLRDAERAWIRRTTSVRRRAGCSTPSATRRRPGWDATTGYGRVNAYELVQAVRDGRIPPEADLTSPAFYDLLPAAGTLRVRGSVAAVRAHSYDYRVEWATALQPPDHPATDTWHVVAERRGTAPPGATAARAARPAPRSRPRCPTAATGAPVDPATGRHRRGALQRPGAGGGHRGRRPTARPRRGQPEAGLRPRRPRPRRAPCRRGSRARAPRSPVFAELEPGGRARS